MYDVAINECARLGTIASYKAQQAAQTALYQEIEQSDEIDYFRPILQDTIYRLSTDKATAFLGEIAELLAQPLHVCTTCYGHGVFHSGALCRRCQGGIAGRGDAMSRQWAELFHTCHDDDRAGEILADVISEYKSAGWPPGLAHSAWMFDWPASRGIADIETMRAAAMADVRVELVSRRGAL